MRVFILTLGIALIAPAAFGADLEPYFEKAASENWRTRWTAVRALAALAGGDDVFSVRKALLRDARPKVRAAIAWACLLEPGLGQSTLLGIALKKDSDPAVRRACAKALVHFRDRRAVSALVDALQREQDPRTHLHIVATLRALTPAPCLLDAGAWRAWWAKNERDPRFVPADEATQKGEYEGVVLETKTVAAVRPKGGRKRPPPHLLVLPGFGWTTAVFGPYLLPVRERAAITWVNLPGVQKLTGRSGYGSDIATYPVERLVKALDRFREAHGLKRFVVLAPGASGWIAMRYAQRYPKRCAGLILLDTALDKQAYVEALRRAAARGTRGEKFIAKTLMHENNAPFNRATLDRIHSLGLERGFLSPSDLEIGAFWTMARDPQGFATVPEIRWGKRARLDVPALFLYSASSTFSRHMDATRIQKHFPRSLVAPIREASGLPFLEANTKFHAIVADFFRRFELAD